MKNVDCEYIINFFSNIFIIFLYKQLFDGKLLYKEPFARFLFKFIKTNELLCKLDIRKFKLFFFGVWNRSVYVSIIKLDNLFIEFHIKVWLHDTTILHKENMTTLLPGPLFTCCRVPDS